MSYIENIIAKFGGARRMARAIGKPESTVRSWRDRASIPDKDKPLILSAGIASGIEISKADFFPDAQDVALPALTGQSAIPYPTDVPSPDR